MALTITHATVASGTNAGNGEIAKEQWNEAHSITGTLSADDVVDGTTNKVFTSTDESKLNGIANNATANDTDANLKNRANHTGTQTASTISDFNTAADGRITNAIGSTVQAYDDQLTSIAGLTMAADTGIYFTDANTATTFTLTLAGRNLLDDATTTNQRNTLGLGTANSPQFTGIEIGDASDTTLTRVSAGRIAVEGNNILLATTENQVVTGGAEVTSKSLGTTSSGTRTLDVADCPLQHYTNGGAHTLAPGTVNGASMIDITNTSGAGAITTSGFTKVAGDSFTTTNGHKFRCHVSVGNAGSLLIVQAFQ